MDAYERFHPIYHPKAHEIVSPVYQYWFKYLVRRANNKVVGKFMVSILGYPSQETINFEMRQAFDQSGWSYETHPDDDLSDDGRKSGYYLGLEVFGPFLGPEEVEEGITRKT